MLEGNGVRIYPLSNVSGSIQGKIDVIESLVKGNARVEIRIVGQIKKRDEKEMAKELENLVKRFYL